VKKLTAVISLLLILGVFLAGCSMARKSEQAPSYDSGYAPGAPTNSAPDAPGTPGLPDANYGKRIKNGDITIQVDDLVKTEASIVARVEAVKGFIQQSSQSGTDEDASLYISVRIPADQFDPFFEGLKSLGEVDKSSSSVTDVTEEYIDLNARKDTLTAQEARLRTMFDQAKSVEEMLQVENELSRVRTEIEQITGRLRYLDNVVSYSTVNIYLEHTEVPVQPKVKNFGQQVMYYLKDGFGVMVTVLVTLVKVAAWLLPFAVIGVPIWLLIRKLVGGKRNNTVAK
jgi:hypothetical protein